MSNIGIVDTTITERFQIQSDASYFPISNDSITLLKTCPANVKYTNLISKGGSPSQLLFQTQVGERNFLHNSIMVTKTFPVKIKLANAHTDDITQFNYATVLKDLICFKQFPLIGVMLTSSVKFNNETVSTNSQIGKCFDMTSQYANESAINEFLDASQRDISYNLSHYGTDVDVATLTTEGKKCIINLPGVHESNIFRNNFNSSYNTRVPIFTWDANSNTVSQLLKPKWD